MTEGARGFATPLDPESAAARARQLDALAEPDRLRVLSVIAAAAGGVAAADSIAGELGFELSVVQRHLALLTEVGLVLESESDADMFRPTADAWMRFGRLIVTPRPRVRTVPPDGRIPADEASSIGQELPPVLRRVAERLAYRFSSSFSAETVEQYVVDSYQRLAQRATVTHHLPSLTSRFAADRLGALAVATGRVLREVPEVLFVCVQNAGRSQLAAALLRQMAGDRVHIRTAGSLPAREIDPVVVTALEELGIPMVAEFPKPLTDEVVQAADFVVTMGCGDACPIYSGRRYLDWPTPDPVGRPLAEVRAIRNDIEVRLARLCTEMGVEVPVAQSGSGSTISR